MVSLSFKIKFLKNIAESCKYKYQGQELQDELGLCWYSFKWCNYDPAIARFMSIDPLAEEYEDYTPYQFASKQPVHANEVEGLENAYDLNKSVETRQSRPVVNDAISRNTQMTRTVERALSAPAQKQTVGRQQPMLSQEAVLNNIKQIELKYKL